MESKELEELQDKKLRDESKKNDFESNKLDLESQKAQKDLDTYEERLKLDVNKFNLEQKKINYDYKKFLGETVRVVLLSIIPLMGTYFITKLQLSEARRQQQVNQFKEDKKIFDTIKGLEEKGKAACNLYEEYNEVDIFEIKLQLKKVKELCNLNQSFDPNENKFELPTNTTKKIEAVESEKATVKQNLKNASKKDSVGLIAKQNQLNTQLTSITTNAPVQENVAKATENFTQSITTQIELANKSSDIPKVVQNDFVLLKSPETQYCKEGHFIPFNNSLKIEVDYLSSRDQEIEVIFTDIEDNKEIPINNTNEKPIRISVGDTYTLNYGDHYRYLVTLNYIGAAGRNPFTKAAYITVATYKK